MDDNLFWNSFMILLTCSMNPETAASNHALVVILTKISSVLVKQVQRFALTLQNWNSRSPNHKIKTDISRMKSLVKQISVESALDYPNHHIN